MGFFQGNLVINCPSVLVCFFETFSRYATQDFFPKHTWARNNYSRNTLENFKLPRVISSRRSSCLRPDYFPKYPWPQYCRGRPRPGPGPKTLPGAMAPPGPGPKKIAGAMAPPGPGPKSFAGALAPPGPGPKKMPGPWPRRGRGQKKMPGPATGPGRP